MEVRSSVNVLVRVLCLWSCLYCHIYMYSSDFVAVATAVVFTVIDVDVVDFAVTGDKFDLRIPRWSYILRPTNNCTPHHALDRIVRPV
jgi:hypothetical protein